MQSPPSNPVHTSTIALASLKERPGNVTASGTASVPAVLDCRSEKMLPAEPKDHSKAEDRMTLTRIPRMTD
jgi:hypothetical protein